MLHSMNMNLLINNKNLPFTFIFILCDNVSNIFFRLIWEDVMILKYVDKSFDIVVFRLQNVIHLPWEEGRFDNFF